MDERETPALTSTLWQAVKRGMLGMCPNCGEGRLFKSYLRPVECCHACSEPLGHIRADDGPAWLTILLVGHILAPLLLMFVPNSTWPDSVQIIFWPVVAFILALVILPRAKGLFIAIIWRNAASVKEISSLAIIPNKHNLS